MNVRDKRKKGFKKKKRGNKKMPLGRQRKKQRRTSAGLKTKSANGKKISKSNSDWLIASVENWKRR